MNRLFILLVLVSLSQFGFAQKKDKKKENVAIEVKQEPRKIIMQLTSADTTVHKMLMKQVKNILSVAPDTKIEIVCHGPGLSMLINEKSIVTKQMEEANAAGVVFAACRFSMKERNVLQEQLVKYAQIVEAGIIEIVDKQNEGWVYIKAG